MTSIKKNLLVTGGAGFIGSNFINYIYKKYPNYNIRLLDALTYAGNLDNISNNLKSNGHFQFSHGNVTQPDIVNQLVSDSDIVVHFAAESHVTRSIYDNSLFFETDVIGTQVIANAIVKMSVSTPVPIFIASPTTLSESACIIRSKASQVSSTNIQSRKLLPPPCTVKA